MAPKHPKPKLAYAPPSLTIIGSMKGLAVTTFALISDVGVESRAAESLLESRAPNSIETLH